MSVNSFSWNKAAADNKISYDEFDQLNKDAIQGVDLLNLESASGLTENELFAAINNNNAIKIDSKTTKSVSDFVALIKKNQGLADAADAIGKKIFPNDYYSDYSKTAKVLNDLAPKVKGNKKLQDPNGDWSLFINIYNSIYRYDNTYGSPRAMAIFSNMTDTARKKINDSLWKRVAQDNAINYKDFNDLRFHNSLFSGLKDTDYAILADINSDNTSSGYGTIHINPKKIKTPEDFLAFINQKLNVVSEIKTDGIIIDLITVDSLKFSLLQTNSMRQKLGLSLISDSDAGNIATFVFDEINTNEDNRLSVDELMSSPYFSTGNLGTPGKISGFDIEEMYRKYLGKTGTWNSAASAIDASPIGCVIKSKDATNITKSLNDMFGSIVAKYKTITNENYWDFVKEKNDFKKIFDYFYNYKDVSGNFPYKDTLNQVQQGLLPEAQQYAKIESFEIKKMSAARDGKITSQEFYNFYNDSTTGKALQNLAKSTHMTKEQIFSMLQKNNMIKVKKNMTNGSFIGYVIGSQKLISQLDIGKNATDSTGAHDGKISFDEWKRATDAGNATRELLNQSKVDGKAAFDAIDINKDGYLSVDELQAKKYTANNFNGAYAGIDFGKDGVISTYDVVEAADDSYANILDALRSEFIKEDPDTDKVLAIFNAITPKKANGSEEDDNGDWSTFESVWNYFRVSNKAEYNTKYYLELIVLPWLSNTAQAHAQRY